MSYKTILAALDSKRSAEHLAHFSASICNDFDAHLVGLHVGTLPTVTVMAPMDVPDPSSLKAMQDVALLEAREIKQTFDDAMTGKGVDYEWRNLLSASGFSAAGAIENARYSDLVIARQSDDLSKSEAKSDIDSFLYESGRPVLLVPHNLTEPRPIKRVIIAWNGSREATRAAFDALPFLTRADDVEIFTFGPEDAPINEDEIQPDVEFSKTLARHGVSVSVNKQSKESGISAQDAISQRLEARSADLLVMGAYGSSRWWEMLFGGVTRSVLNNMSALTLMSR